MMAREGSGGGGEPRHPWRPPPHTLGFGPRLPRCIWCKDKAPATVMRPTVTGQHGGSWTCACGRTTVTSYLNPNEPAFLGGDPLRPGAFGATLEEEEGDEMP